MFLNFKSHFILAVFLFCFGIAEAKNEQQQPQLKRWLVEIQKKPQVVKVLKSFPRILLGLQENEGTKPPDVVNFMASNTVTAREVKGNMLKILKGSDVQVSLMINEDFVDEEKEDQDRESKTEKLVKKMKSVVDFQAALIFPTDKKLKTVTLSMLSPNGSRVEKILSKPELNWTRSEFVKWYFKELGIDAFVLDKKKNFLLLAGNELTLLPGKVGFLTTKNSKESERDFFRNPNQEPIGFLKIIEGKNGLAIAELQLNSQKIEMSLGSYAVFP